MKSFICITDACDLVLSIRYNVESKTFKLYLHGIQTDFQNNSGINFYCDGSSCPIKPEKIAILNKASELVHRHYIWINHADFEKWFNHYWDSYSKDDLYLMFS